MKRSQHILAVLAALTLCSGCIIPIPHRRLHAYGVRGSVIDVDSRLPIQDAEVARGTNMLDSVSCSEQGKFTVKPIHGWHGAYFIGPVSLSLFPGWDIIAPRTWVRASAPGYKTETFFLTDTPEKLAGGPTNGNGHVNIKAEIAGNYILAEPLTLKRKQTKDTGLPTKPSTATE